MLIFFNATPSVYADHSEYIETACETPGDVTRTCLECHEEQGEAFIHTAHWLWRGETPFMKNHESATQFGKTNLINNY